MHSDFLLENVKKGDFVKTFFSRSVRKVLHCSLNSKSLLLTCSSEVFCCFFSAKKPISTFLNTLISDLRASNRTSLFTNLCIKDVMTLLKSRERKGTKGFNEIKMKPKTVEVALLRSSKVA